MRRPVIVSSVDSDILLSEGTEGRIDDGKVFRQILPPLSKGPVEELSDERGS